MVFGRSFTLLLLVLLHGLTDVMLAVYRARGLDPATLDMFAATLSRS